ncbi:hypothetical protein [Stenomitos frigidus]|uniref:RSAM-associated Gly-rich repeat protein n=1 Tax=Stenomitos frigidus ULC18 TaxID=2107698 RepID=A0A2T1EAW6_9CYAN|nr:hypothetical protein [Stenomitos frigidus]PSB29887.1 hypothetical protein C7B82_10060 [Stenomitos frigidus ULC18]
MKNKRLLLLSIAAFSAAQLTAFITVQTDAQAYRPGSLNQWAERSGNRWRRYRPGDLNQWAARTGERFRRAYLTPRATVRLPTRYDEWGSN